MYDDLIISDFSLPFILKTDANSMELGADLYQQQGDCMRVIAYVSRRLCNAEKIDPLCHLKDWVLSSKDGWPS